MPAQSEHGFFPKSPFALAEIINGSEIQGRDASPTIITAAGRLC
jgi:hypothetical protein